MSEFKIDREEIAYFLELGKIKYCTPYKDKYKMEKYFWEINELSVFLNRYLKEDFVCMDIGARDGDSLLPLYPILSPNGSKIICFEPNKNESKYIKHNAQINGFHNVDVYEFGIAKATEDMVFLFDKEGRNGGLDVPLIHYGEWEEQRTLPCMAPKDFPQHLKDDLEKVDYIKIDTEGSDIPILRLLMNYVNKPFIMAEWWIGSELLIKDFVKDFGYKVYDPKTGMRLKGLDPTKRIDNLFLVPNTHLDAIYR